MAYITNTVKNVTGTSLYINDAIQEGILYEGVNNITQTNNDLPFVIDLSYYSSENPYQDAIYSQGETNDLKIWFDDVELEDADRYCESITRTARIIPDDGAKRFSLDNFISTSVEVILHDVDPSIIKDQVKISIGTDIGNNEFEYIPLGIFNIQDVPETNGNKITIKLRDNRVKFDFNYDAYPLMQSLGGQAKKRQILEDICEKAGVENKIDYFANEDDYVGIYDDSIQAQTYVSYLMEQAGLIATIDRYGKLIAIDLSNLYKWKIPLSIVEGWDKGDPYKIERVVYESGIIKYETSSDESLDTLYINSANPYITSDTQVEDILEKLQNFEIDSITTKRVLGNPAIDPYDIIEVYNDLDGTNDVVFRTLGNTSYTFNGVHRDSFNTQIGREERTENVSKNSNEAKFKRAFTEIDNVEGTVKINTSSIETITATANNAIEGVGEINRNLANYYTIEQTNELISETSQGITNTFQTSGGANIFRNTGLWFATYDSNNPYEFWTGKVVKTSENKAANRSALLLQNNTLEQQEEVPNGTYSISFKYKKLIAVSNISAVINGTTYELTETTDKEFELSLDVASQYINIKFISDTDNAGIIYDLMVNYGQKMAYSQNQNETTTDTVNISKGITITSSDTNTRFKADSDGTRIFNSETNEIKSEFTDKGLMTDELEANKATIANLLIQDVEGQTWLSRI